MTASHRCKDVSDRVWEQLPPLLAGEAGKVNYGILCSVPRKAVLGSCEASFVAI